MRTLFSAKLEGLGAQVEAVANAEGALAFLEDKRPDLIVCDAVMPTTDGFKLCRMLKDDPRYRDIPFTILTSLARGVAERSLEAGADDYFHKAMDESLLRLRIMTLLELSVMGAYAAKPLEAFGGARVLVASPAANLLTQVSLQLSRAGLHVEEFPGAGELMDRLSGPAADLLILDSELGSEPMVNLAKAVRKAAGWTEVPILVLAAKGEEAAMDPLKPFIHDWITKPLDAKELRRRLQVLLCYAGA